MTTKGITRTAGEIPRTASGHPLPWGGPMPGGGWSGETKELDQAVLRLARDMRKLFATVLKRRQSDPAIPEIEVRFNSHRRSGGAFVKLLTGDNCFGFSAALSKSNRRIDFAVNVAGKWLNNPRHCNSGGHGLHPYCYRYFRNPQDLTDWVRQNVGLFGILAEAHEAKLAKKYA